MANHTVAEYREFQAAIERQIADPAKSVQYQDYSLDSWSHQQLVQRWKWLDGQIKALEGKPRRRVLRLNTRKGL